MDEKPATYFGNKGYTIYKENLELEEQELIRKELTVSPYVPKNSPQQPISFPVYRESSKKIYLPRYYGYKNYGEPEEMRVSPGKKINLKFSGSLRPKQVPVVEKYMEHIKTSGGGLLALHTGFGKCLARGTSIMLSNGKIKKVENIKVGDKLMGDDSTPRTVLSLARGREMMYDVIPTKGDKYTVNESHILSLRCSYGNGNKNYIKGKIIDIEVIDFLKLPKTIKNHLLKGYRVPIHFTKQKVELDPYILGYWLGDGTSRSPEITTIDEPVIKYFKMYCQEQGLFLKQGLGRNNISYRMSFGKKNRKGISGSGGKNPVLNMLKLYNLINNKHIPHIYKCNSKSIRLELLAGIIDSCGYNKGCYDKGCYDIVQKNEKLLDDIIYVARSLGFAAYKKKCHTSCMYKEAYYRTSIHGYGIEYIPVKLVRKASKRKQIKNVLNTGIKLVKKEVDEYFGFEIDGNRRFVLGDFTVTHNTCIGLNIISRINLKTLIIVHKEFLLRQWVERIEQFLPDARVGRIQAKIIDVEDKDIVICMLQSLSMKEYSQELFNEYGLTIVDECHHISSEVFSRSLFKVVSKYMLGLSATVKRKDRLTYVIKMFLGDIVCKIERKGEDKVTVKCINYISNNAEFNEVAYDYRGMVKYSTMIKKICEFKDRSEFILIVLKDIIDRDTENKAQIMVLAHNKSVLKYLHDAIKERNYSSVGYYVGGMKEKDLKISEKKKVIIATYAMAEEGLDIKTLTTLLMATPRVDVTQAVGRILRMKHDNTEVYDILDQHALFQRHWKKRKTFYRKQKFKILTTTCHEYLDGKWDCIFDAEKKASKKARRAKNPLLTGKCLID